MSQAAPIRFGTVGVVLLLAAAALAVLGLALGEPFFTPKHAGGHGEAEASAEGHDAEGGHGGEGGFGAKGPPMWSVIPFLVLLVVIAVLPLLPHASHWWEHNRNKLLVSVVLGAPVAVYVCLSDKTRVLHSGIEYFQFLSLLSGLFITAGGLHITGNLVAKPSVNLVFLMIGYVLASLIGTTGAAMVLIYPVLRTNLERKFKAHTVIFFIFLICNTGGLLTPIGDPPLFLGYLRGIDFFWFLKLAPMWAVNGVILFTLYYFLDLHYYRKEVAKDLAVDRERAEPVRLKGGLNLLFLLAIVMSVAASVNSPYREAIMFCAAGVSLLYANRSHEAHVARERNQFNFNAILEVAAVFAGIFATMIPALMLLELRGGELGVTRPLEYFYATGAFSSFLDNAPTFLCFSTLAIGANNLSSAGDLMAGAPIILGAVSLGAVFMGANTYIGNAPNFMVRSIAEQQGVKMPSFFGYMAWAAVILIPVFTLVAAAFLVWIPFPLY